MRLSMNDGYVSRGWSTTDLPISVRNDLANYRAIQHDLTKLKHLINAIQSVDRTITPPVISFENKIVKLEDAMAIKSELINKVLEHV